MHRLCHVGDEQNVALLESHELLDEGAGERCEICENDVSACAWRNFSRDSRGRLKELKNREGENRQEEKYSRANDEDSEQSPYITREHDVPHPEGGHSRHDPIQACDEVVVLVLRPHQIVKHDGVQNKDHCKGGKETQKEERVSPARHPLEDVEWLGGKGTKPFYLGFHLSDGKRVGSTIALPVRRALKVSASERKNLPDRVNSQTRVETDVLRCHT